MDIPAKIEAILFHRSEPVSFDRLAKVLDIPANTVQAGLNELKDRLKNRGITLMEKDDQVMMATAPEAADLIEKIIKDELSEDLGKAALETLTIILYRSPVARADIDYIRGVNSSFILRHLTVRGLIERVSNPHDARSYLYRPTFDLLSHLGITELSALPEFESIKQELADFLIKENEKTESPINQ
ncbi:MAG: SMC-Scp complex subunit ScpB [Candidatus Paceibacterota bacterium]